MPSLVPLGKPPSPSGFLWEPSLRWVLWLGPKGGPLSLVVLAGTPRGLEFDMVKEELLGASGVRGVHDLHLWALTLSHPVVSVHVAVGE